MGRSVFVCGLDEAGRGPLAGPVSAGAVILPEDFPLEILNDSKKLTPKKRVYAEKIIKEKACWGVAFVDNKEIDRINILNASLKAMRDAYLLMMQKFPAWAASLGYDCVDLKMIDAVADGTFCPELDCSVRAVVKADATFPEVMAASILAKESRDALMLEYDAMYPEYGYAKHKGYPTKAHREVCKRIGPSPIQRLSFSYC